jgi:hypothetical protein
MARPSTRALSPLIDLFYRLPASALEQLQNDRAFRSAIARLLRWTLLALYIDQPDLEQLLIDSHGIDEALDDGAPVPVWGPDSGAWQEQLRQALGRYQTSLATLWSRKRAGFAERYGWSPLVIEGLPSTVTLNELALDAFTVDVSEARSLQHPAVGWLYAIERRGGATEFLWQAQYDGFLRDSQTGIPSGQSYCEAVLQRAVGADAQALYPEKQHIVPFVIARQIVNKGGTRATASPANAIGNLTWLSRRQNTLDALADRWTVMDRERDRDNLAARGMFAHTEAEAESRSALALYEELQKAVLDNSWVLDQPRTHLTFDAFCNSRAAWMVAQMRDWLEEPLSDEACEWLPT